MPNLNRIVVVGNLVMLFVVLGWIAFMIGDQLANHRHEDRWTVCYEAESKK